VKNPTLLAAALIVVGLNPTFASDQDVKSRQGGKYHVTAGRIHNMHANDHARMLRKYAALGDKVPSDVVQEHAAAIRSSTEAATKSFARLGKTAGDNAALAKQVAQLQKRLDKVSLVLKQLEAQSAGSAADSKMVTARTNEISQHLRANHNDLRTIDNDFYDSDSDAYYETGEGHLVD
jgi:uncharacterized membrane protein YccC